MVAVTMTVNMKIKVVIVALEMMSCRWSLTMVVVIMIIASVACVGVYTLYTGHCTCMSNEF